VVRNVKLATPFDGNLTASVLGDAGLRLALYSGKKRIAYGTGSTATTLCGSRALTLRVTRASGRGAFTVTVSLP
jgi:hypothetical protein